MSSQIEEIKQKLDIISVVSSYVPSLKPAGRNHFGLCPFHGEKSPSFSVNPELGIFKCFGCGEGGDVISFIQKIEGLEFRDALEIAADRAGVELIDFKKQDKGYKKERERALKAHNLAAEYYHYVLLNHKLGKPGLDYAIEKRKLDKKVIQEYKLGYAPEGYHNLEKFLEKKGFNKAELVKCGLLVSKNGRIYDKFRDRLLNPIYSLRGDVIGFSGRAISKDALGPKYLNTPETIIYQKRREIYGLYHAKQAIREEKSVVVVEGNIDVISSARVGLKNIVCPLGTALTVEQLKMLKRYAASILFCFDTDEAGRRALLKSLELAEEVGLEAKALDLGKYKDVDDLIVAEPEKWSKVVAGALPIPEYALKVLSRNYNLSEATEKANFVEQILEFIGKVNNKIKREHYLGELEQKVGIRYQTLAAELKRVADQPQQAVSRVMSKGSASHGAVAVDKKASGEVDGENGGETNGEKVESMEPEKPVFRLANDRNFIALVNHLYAYREILTPHRERLAGIYRGNLAKAEEILIDASLDLEASGEKADKDSGDQLAQLLALGGKVNDIEAADVLPALERMLIYYVVGRLKGYLRILREEGDLQRLQRISEKIAGLQKQRA